MNGRFSRVPILISGLIHSQSERAATSDSGLDSGLQVSVVFTTPKRTPASLRALSGFSKDLSARVTLVVAEVVLFHFPLEKPAVSIDFLERRQLSLLAEAGLHAGGVRIEICLCRGSMQFMVLILKLQSIVVVGRGKNRWATQERKPAHLPRAQGHQVILVDAETEPHIRHFLNYFANWFSPGNGAIPPGQPATHHPSQKTRQERNFQMNLAIWLPGMFLLGIAGMELCLLFLDACEKI